LGQADQPPSLHRYVYAWNRPTFWRDTSGHAPGDEPEYAGYEPVLVDGQIYGIPRYSQTIEVTASQDPAYALPQTVGGTVTPINRAAETTVRVAGVAGLGVAAGTLALAPEPTGTTKATAAYLGLRFVDETQALIRGTESEAHQGARMALELGGVKREDASFYASTGIGATDALVGAAGFRSAAQQRSSKPIEGIAHEPRATVNPRPATKPLPTSQPEPATATPTVTTTGSGPVRFKPPANATPEQLAQWREATQVCNECLQAGELSSTGRVSTKGALRRAATRDIAKEKARAAAAGTPYRGHAAHMPDTTWTGKPTPPRGYRDYDPAVNTSMGSQAKNYPVGYKPTEFVLEEPKPGEPH
jgi:hypothetical protein